MEFIHSFLNICFCSLIYMITLKSVRKTLKKYYSMLYDNIHFVLILIHSLRLRQNMIWKLLLSNFYLFSQRHTIYLLCNIFLSKFSGKITDSEQNASLYLDRDLVQTSISDKKRQLLVNSSLQDADFQMVHLYGFSNCLPDGTEEEMQDEETKKVSANVTPSKEDNWRYWASLWQNL